jgi:SAM-dependent methyltransferase
MESGKICFGGTLVMKTGTALILDLLKQKSDPAEILVKLAIRRALSGCESVLDIGCGASPAMRQLGVAHPVGFEGYKPSADLAKQRNTHDEIVLGDVRDLERHFRPGQFDACIALDVIEHLPKPDGIKMMQAMEKVAARKVVLFTPSGFLPQKHTDNDDLQEHLSGWEPSEMAGYGYQVTGLLGPKRLRGEYHVIKKQPRAFWGLVSLFEHLVWTRNHPEKAAAMLCVKNLVRG